MSDSERQRNRAVAAADRQAVFSGACASCHRDPTNNKIGSALFQAACAICHLSANSGGVVPRLAFRDPAHDAAYWRAWVMDGRAGSLMPAFSKANGGPLSDEQIESLVTYFSELSGPGDD